MANRFYIAELEEVKGNTEKEDELWTKYSTVYRAYLDSQKAENEDLNFYEIIWEKDIESIILNFLSCAKVCSMTTRFEESAEL